MSRSYGILRLMQLVPLFVTLSALLLIYAVEHPSHVGYALLALIAFRALR